MIRGSGLLALAAAVAAALWVLIRARTNPGSAPVSSSASPSGAAASSGVESGQLPAGALEVHVEAGVKPVFGARVVISSAAHDLQAFELVTSPDGIARVTV
jgi:hypothetical protein